MGDDPSKLGVSIQPKMTVLLQAHQGLVCCCVGVWLLYDCICLVVGYV